MKKIVLCLLLAGVLSCSQRSNSLTSAAKKIFNRKEPVKKRQCAGARIIVCNSCYSPYILKEGDKIFESPVIDTVAGTAIYNSLKRDWIQSSFEFLDDEELRNRHGRPAKRFGVELITLKNGTLEKLPLDLRNKFVTEEIKSIYIEITERYDYSKPARISLIEYQKNENGSFLTSKCTVDGKKKRIGKVTEIDKQRINTFIESKNSDKQKFYVNDYISNKSLHYRKDSKIIKIDSLELSEKYSRLEYPYMGGYVINIFIKNQAYSDIIFQKTNDLVKIRNYLLVYKLLESKVPAKFPKAELFSEAKFDAVLNHYFQTYE